MAMNKDEALRLLAESRAKIDELDRQLVELLNRRTRIVEDIGRAKEAPASPFTNPVARTTCIATCFLTIKDL